MTAEEAGRPTAAPDEKRYGREACSTYVDGDALIVAHLGGLELPVQAPQVSAEQPPN